MGSMIGDRSTSDVVARLRTPDGRDEWIYCHSHILVKKSKYFAERLSENWPTCQILDSRNCVEVYCQEHDFDHHITVLRLFYLSSGFSVSDMWHGVKNALGILQVAVTLGCPDIIAACVDYIEASPWEEPEEEEILKVIPGMGLLAERILARLQPVNPATIVKIFLSAIQFATSALPPTMLDLKTSAQEQIEYMLTEDDDAPLLTADEAIKSKVRQYFKGLLARFNNTVKSACETGETHRLQCFLADMSWACQILAKMEMLKDFVGNWIDASENIVKAVNQVNHSQDDEMLETNLKVIEVTSKVLEAIGYGSVIQPTVKRLHMVRIWLPFVRNFKPLIDSLTTDENGCSVIKMDGEIWQSLESAFVSIILALPSGEQAEILNEWLQNKQIRYPDLTEVFEVWCYRSKVANRRLSHIRGSNGMIKKL
uniref:BTB/POZ domain-containing protein At3g05675 n=1 Tax=Erigeron canadensis TaxID=72917 RepID=UPI001CB9D501|nr:BTB/POZ domain-containing protein At3g05675 [Erigeron canadensis]XP_043639703.1 BTB/POZ domain-containing protein At3g05675 [Erigeron canadensis]XP_043639711.1 BTB/POZ domain-containing protein At3g05675 [Erigeron canadensis]XP_043639717.1 BTB/POZ domain-containing protein At3g05675 [Erigeron canadensis]XP_043639725.1 BTB/POZ domain-containing protein At3g05675 [Erigeron canadensis]